MEIGKHPIAKVEIDKENVSERNHPVGPFQVLEKDELERDRQIKQSWCLSLIFYTRSTNEWRTLLI